MSEFDLVTHSELPAPARIRNSATVSPYRFCPGVGEIVVELTKGFCTLIDATDAPLVCTHRWKANVQLGRGKVYAIRSSRSKTTKLHRLLTSAPKHLAVDHINGDSLDNRRRNLKLVSLGANNHNREYELGASGFRGVRAHRGRYEARICFQETSRYLGSFKTAEDAARQYDAAAREIYGIHAILNFYPEGLEPLPSPRIPF